MRRSVVLVLAPAVLALVGCSPAAAPAAAGTGLPPWGLHVDSWTRSRGLLTAADAEATARLLVERAHRAGLQVAQKNAAGLDGVALGFDYAVTEQCQVFDECDACTDAYGDRVIEVEYTDDAFAAACAARGDEVAVQRRDLDVSVPGTDDYVSRFCRRAVV